jgi:hypothetical protein
VNNASENEYRAELRQTARSGLKRLKTFLDGRSKMTDDDRLAAKLGVATVSADVRLVSADTNRMAVELMLRRHEADKPVTPAPSNGRAIPASK